MSTLLYALRRGDTPASQEVVRRTAEPVSLDTPPAEMQHEPEFNEVKTDPNPDLGMGSRALASDWHQGEKYPANWADKASYQHNERVNRQVASAGYAANKEATQVQGHGSLSYAVGIEPVLRDGVAFGSDYFAVDKRNIQEPAGNYMSVPPNNDSDNVVKAASTGKASARSAASAAYAMWYAQSQGGA